MDGYAPLDNALWSAMTTRQAAFAIGHGLARRFPPEIGPFAAVRDSSDEAMNDLARIVAPGESVCLTSVIPTLSGGWDTLRHAHIVQFVRPAGPILPDSRFDYRDLTDAEIPAMVELTALVYPAYFRAGTPRLGGYVGVFQGDQLVAMAGERMNCDGFTEISGVCTHPDHRGHHYAARLSEILIHRIQSRGDTAFLHADADNLRAQAIYQSLGFVPRQNIPLWVIQRSSP